MKNDIVNPLSGWIGREHPIPNRFHTKTQRDNPDKNWSVWLSLQEVALLHNVNQMAWQSLKESREETAKYLTSAADIINGLEGGWLDREEQQWILQELGEPPAPCLPIYLISCEDTAGHEELVYVGKTKTVSRFTGGHSAALKLHDPQFDNKSKKIYRAAIWFYYDDEYVALDWIRPEEIALKLLDSIESQLIHFFQPRLNTHKKLTRVVEWDFYIHIQNFLEGGFLNDEFVG